MAKKLDPKEMVCFEELLIGNTYEQDALVNLIERMGIITKAQLLEEIDSLKGSVKKKPIRRTP